MVAIQIERSAVISDCGLYRYSLTRRWGPDRSVVAWIMLNPSTADAKVDDPTIRRCISFSRDWGYDALEVVNLFALRSANPSALREAQIADIDPIGRDNDKIIEFACSRAKLVIAAWGAHPIARTRVESLPLTIAKRLFCLGMTKDLSPRHPLYVPKRQDLERWG